LLKKSQDCDCLEGQVNAYNGHHYGIAASKENGVPMTMPEHPHCNFTNET